jgi:dTDP-4-dehydrorhamnose 3,5-epimerase
MRRPWVTIVQKAAHRRADVVDLTVARQAAKSVWRSCAAYRRGDDLHAASLEIPEVKLVVPAVHKDARGTFAETYNALALENVGIRATFVQDNQSLSVQAGTIRGLHFQSPPHAQDKLVRVTRGAILDVAVDIRAGSPTFGRYVAEVLSAENWHQLWVPQGFAHGFCTLEPDTEVVYKVTDYYAPQSDHGIAWSDPAIAIRWPVAADDAVLSEKDRTQPNLASSGTFFFYPR